MYFKNNFILGWKIPAHFFIFFIFFKWALYSNTGPSMAVCACSLLLYATLAHHCTTSRLTLPPLGCRTRHYSASSHTAARQLSAFPMPTLVAAAPPLPIARITATSSAPPLLINLLLEIEHKYMCMNQELYHILLYKVG